jgi:hypothetical protein
MGSHVPVYAQAGDASSATLTLRRRLVLYGLGLPSPSVARTRNWIVAPSLTGTACSVAPGAGWGTTLTNCQPVAFNC